MLSWEKLRTEELAPNPQHTHNSGRLGHQRTYLHDHDGPEEQVSQAQHHHNRKAGEQGAWKKSHQIKVRE